MKGIRVKVWFGWEVPSGFTCRICADRNFTRPPHNCYMQTVYDLMLAGF